MGLFGFNFKQLTMATSAKFIIILVDERMTKFMQCADLFSKDKVIAKIDECVFTFEETKKVDYELCEKVINSFLTTTENKLSFAFIHLHSIIDEDQILLNRKLQCKPYINKEIRQISDGNKSFMFHDFLTKLEMPFELDENCFIK